MLNDVNQLVDSWRIDSPEILACQRTSTDSNAGTKFCGVRSKSYRKGPRKKGFRGSVPPLKKLRL